MDRPENANEECVGPKSEQAGKVSGCEGCPNQKACASGEAAQVDPAVAEVAVRLADVKHKLLVLSGKGGVGKSTFSTQLSLSLALDEDTQVGILDVDICGPSVPRMLGLEGREIRQSNRGWEPVFVEDNLAVMSIGFMLPNKDDAVIWRGPKKNGMIKQFLKDVDWGHLDYLVLDTPPGTSDEHLSIVTYLKEANVDGAVIVTTPQEVALLDVRKEINFCKKVGIRVIGVVENMSGFVCPHCACETQIFMPNSGGAEKMAAEMDVPFLGRIPLDPRLMNATEQGKSYIKECGDTVGGKALAAVVKAIQENVAAIKK